MDDSKNGCRKIRADRAIEYAIFLNEPVTIFLKDAPEKKTAGRMIELSKQNLSVEFKKDVTFNRLLSDAKDNKQVLCVQLSYRSAVLLMEATITEMKVATSTTELYLHVPTLALLENSRALPRYTLAEITDNLFLQLTIVSGAKTINLETTQLQDLSEHAISFFFSPEKGTILPGDIVKSMKLYQDERLLMEATGEVGRVDSKRNGTNQAKKCLGVVRFRHLSAEHVHKSNHFEERRRSIRLRMDEQPGSVHFRHPLFKEYEVVGELLEVNAAGISFVVSEVFCPLPLGMYIRNMVVSLPNQKPFQVTMKLVHCRREQVGGKNQIHIGGEFSELSAESLTVLKAA